MSELGRARGHAELGKHAAVQRAAPAGAAGHAPGRGAPTCTAASSRLSGASCWSRRAWTAALGRLRVASEWVQEMSRRLTTASASPASSPSGAFRHVSASWTACPPASGTSSLSPSLLLAARAAASTSTGPSSGTAAQKSRAAAAGAAEGSAGAASSTPRFSRRTTGLDRPAARCSTAASLALGRLPNSASSCRRPEWCMAATARRQMSEAVWEAAPAGTRAGQ